MQQGSAERRRGRRVNLEAPLLIRHLKAETGIPFTQKVIGNVSLNGVYFETDDSDPYTVNDEVMASVSIPESQRRIFPFTRVAGRSRVVRVSELGHQPTTGQKRIGVALEFGDNVTALTAIPSRG